MNVRTRCLLSTVLLLAAVPAYAQHVEIAAVVNDDVITSADVSQRRDLLMAFDHLPDTAENQQKLTPRVLNSLIEEALEMQEAKRLSISVTDEDVGKAITQLETERHQPPGSVKTFLAQHQLSTASLEAQIRAQLGWNKVVQRKLRRAVSVSEDEVLRAQQAQAAAPGFSELRLAALAVPMKSPEDADRAKALADTLSAELKSNGNNLAAVGLAHEKDGVITSPPRWVREDNLPPPMAQVLTRIKPGEVTPPLRASAGYQLIQLSDRRVTKPLPDNTEVAIKEIRIAPPTTQSKEALEALRQQTLNVRAHPGSCTEEALGVPAANAQAKFLRAKLGPMAEEVRNIVTQLGVGEISDPIVTPGGVELIMLCERIEPAVGGLPEEAPIREKLFQEKLELEAEKYLRDLKRDAYIDIKGADTPHAATP